MSDVPQKSLERYDVLDRIAVGGMAEVFLAKAYGAHGFEKTLAIKRILPELAQDPEFEDRFIAEAKVAVRLSHTNVVQVFDFGRFAGSLFIAMEFVDGLDLAALLRRLRDRGTKIPVAAAFQIAIELMRGLDFAHQHGVVHRDVSPSNILLSRAGEVKIADFGIAVAAQPARSGSTGGRKKVMGKWRYMSPEQARGEAVDTKSDLFSAAAVIYEMFTSEKLFPGDEAEDIIRNISEMPIPKMAVTRPGLPAKLDDIMAGALARYPDQRPVRPAVVLRALTELTYESSIISTALDVAEVVSDALDTATPTGKRLDAIIRAQLVNLAQESSQIRRTARGDHERKTADATLAPLEVDRKTAVTRVQRSKRPTDQIGGDDLDPSDESVPVLKSTIGSDGLTRLELDETTIAVAIWTKPGEPPAMPMGSRSALSPSASLTADLPRQPPASTRRGWLLATAVATVAVAAVVVMWPRSSRPQPPVIATIAVDAAPAPSTGTVVIESVPPGAHGTLGDLAVTTTPITVVVPGGMPLTLHLELAGFRPYDDESVEVSAGQSLRVRALLTAAGARLVVTSVPDQADVTIDGVRVGLTPLSLDNLAAHNARIAISKAGYVTVIANVALTEKQTADVARTLRPTPTPTGTIALQVVDGWGVVYLGSKKIGQAPAESLTLPLGHHRLRIVNPPTGHSASIDVFVTSDETRFYKVQIP
jgi:serine/threonine protein kinase